jgi:hypothetical protein
MLLPAIQPKNCPVPKSNTVKSYTLIIKSLYFIYNFMCKSPAEKNDHIQVLQWARQVDVL